MKHIILSVLSTGSPPISPVSGLFSVSQVLFFLRRLLTVDLSQLAGAPSSSPPPLSCSPALSSHVPAAVLSAPHSQGSASPVHSASLSRGPDPKDVNGRYPASLTSPLGACPGSRSLSRGTSLRRIQFCLQEAKPHGMVTAEVTLLFSSQGCLNSRGHGPWLIQVNIRHKSWSFYIPLTG